MKNLLGLQHAVTSLATPSPRPGQLVAGKKRLHEPGLLPKAELLTRTLAQSSHQK